jgi:hypothetical protein
LPTLERYATGLASDKANPTETESRMIEIAQTARGASMLILSEAVRSGFIQKVDGSWNLSRGAKELARFLSIERATLQALGLERRAKPVPALQDYMQQQKADA